MDVATLVASMYGGEPPFAVEAFDGSSVPARAHSPTYGVTVRVMRRDALARILRAPGELGIARAYVTGDIEVDGDLFALLSAPTIDGSVLRRRNVRRALLALTGSSLARPPAPVPIEARTRGIIHSRARDRQAVTHHYDVSNRFYEMVLGEMMTYSCAAFASPDDSLEDAQRRKIDLVARKLALRPGARLLDIGCGWGSFALRAAKEYGASVVGVTLSEPQAGYASDRARRDGLEHQVEFRVCDYRDLADEPFDAVCSIGMSEHVGRRGLDSYIDRLYSMLRPGGRLLNHAIGRPITADGSTPPSRARVARRQVEVALGMRGPSRIKSDFMDRFVFPDGELQDAGTMVTLMQARGLEVRHLESLREHYALTLRHWISNLESRWDDAVAEVGEPRARVWRLYMTGSVLGFERNDLEVHQILAVRPDHGASGVQLREAYEPPR